MEHALPAQTQPPTIAAHAQALSSMTRAPVFHPAATDSSKDQTIFAINAMPTVRLVKPQAPTASLALQDRLSSRVATEPQALV